MSETSKANDSHESPVSLRQVAEAAGVSRMTASRAFKEGASIKPEVRAKVLKVAQRLGYAPDKMVSELMTSFVKRRPIDYRETIAVVWWPERWNQVNQADSYTASIQQGIQRAAARHGCTVEEVVLSPELPPRAIDRMLKARGIQGVILTPPQSADQSAPDLDWDELCVVRLGSSLRNPKFHCVQASHYKAMVHVLEKVSSLGYKRPCLLAQTDMGVRMQRAFAAAFMAWVEDGSNSIWHAESVYDSGLLEWLEEKRADVIVADCDEWYPVLKPQLGKYGFVSLAVKNPDDVIAGNYQNSVSVAESAVDLLMQARFRHETGIPAEPLLLLTTGSWVEGSTLPDLLSA
ncbi:LacI family DNA-binding transcriptional regulator [Rubellicoccus peritrichatus]|uniref:LacI family DNA-binding transcriptional regulator n=1 Tax=Rubellicoccus peritrichatus TaxID=3080537 RepID=A0AAQ3LBK8_9BACT|nr:LacI family DNA-binding transcriptional regulator [Puniceicoccus sp. CR14]WOO41529.1 LacI family DNA-binding transcriptional regulator [Puniceicoccus sp. CR14]